MMREMDCLIEMQIVPERNDTVAFNENTAKLLQGIRECGSMVDAAKQSNVAYSYAWRRVNKIEDSLGVKLVDRTLAKGSKLTKDGERLLDMYCAVREKAQQAAHAAFNEFMRP
jgi:molybdate transport repressor ModE-like protein